MKTIEAKIYPNKQQVKTLEALFENSRLIYNQILEKKINYYKDTGKPLGRGELQKLFKTDKLPASLSQMMVYRVNNAYQRFFAKQNKFPRFKSVNRFRSIELRQYGNDYIIKNGRLFAWKKFGLTNLKLRGLEEFEIAKMGRIVKRANGWYLQMSIGMENKESIKKVKSAAGIDVGLKSFLTDNTGKKIDAPKFFVKTQHKLKIAQRKLCKATKGSNRRKVKRKNIIKIHEKIANQRKDFLHKLSRQYVNEFDLIAVENLNIKGMSLNHHLSKAILDASWGQFTKYLGYKLEMLGKVFVEVNPRFTTQECSKCGNLVQKSLSVRTHICECGYIADRDENAAKNIMRIGLGQAHGEGIAIANSLTRKMI